MRPGHMDMVGCAADSKGLCFSQETLSLQVRETWV
jgi:hypothetical protein